MSVQMDKLHTQSIYRTKRNDVNKFECKIKIC